MIYRFLILVFFVVLSCKKKESTSILVIGHGGMGIEFSGSIYADNSKEAIQLCFDMEGTDGVEIDVHLSKDGDLWAYHSDDLSDNTNSSGCIENLLLQDLEDLKYKGLNKERLVRLKDMNLQHANKRILLDLRHFNSCSGLTIDVNDMILALNDLPEYLKNPSRVRVITRNPYWISHLINASFKVIYANDIESEVREALQINPQLNGVIMKNSDISKTQVTNFKSQGLSVFIYEVRSPKALKEIRNKDPDGVLSDDVQGAIIELK